MGKSAHDSATAVSMTTLDWAMLRMLHPTPIASACMCYFLRRVVAGDTVCPASLHDCCKYQLTTPVGRPRLYAGPMLGMLRGHSSKKVALGRGLNSATLYRARRGKQVPAGPLVPYT